MRLTEKKRRPPLADATHKSIQCIPLNEPASTTWACSYSHFPPCVHTFLIFVFISHHIQYSCLLPLCLLATLTPQPLLPALHWQNKIYALWHAFNSSIGIWLHTLLSGGQLLQIQKLMLWMMLPCTHIRLCHFFPKPCLLHCSHLVINTLLWLPLTSSESSFFVWLQGLFSIKCNKNAIKCTQKLYKSI